MSEFRMAGAFVEARLDRTKLDSGIAKLKGENVKVGVRADLDDRAANTRIAALIKARRLKVGVDLDDKAAVAALTKLGKSRIVKLTANLDDKAAVAGLTKLTANRKVKILGQLDDKAALAALTKLTKARTVKVKVDLDQTAMARLMGSSYTADVLAQINDPAYQRAKKLLDRLTADRTVRILASADTRVAADEIRNLTRRQRVRIGLDVDTRVAAADIANLTRRRVVRVTADADTAAASARLAILTRDRRVNIRTNMTGLAGLGSAGGALGSAGSSLGGLSSSVFSLAGAALAALPAVASLATSIAQMAPAAALAVPALGSLLTMGGALAVGLHGVGDAFKAAFDTGTASATSAASSARSLEAAQTNVARSARSLKEAQVDSGRQIVEAQARVKEAVQGVRDAEVKGAAERMAALRRVTDAERDLVAAQKDAKRAQDDLTQARKDAAQQLEELNDRLVSAQLDQRDAVFGEADARKALDALKAKGAAASADDVARAQLAYDQAVERLHGQQVETKRLQEQTAAANKAGVEGSSAVAGAQQGITDAQQKVVDKTRDLSDAQANNAQVGKDSANAVRQAQKQLADAQQGVADAQTSAARQVRGAQEALADAQLAVAAAMASGSSQASKLNDAMSKLSPNARSFITAIKDLSPAWTSLRVDVQDALFRNFGTTVKKLAASALPSLHDGLVGMGGVLNRMGLGLMNTFRQLADQGLLKRMFSGFTEGMRPLERVPGQLGKAFVQLSIAAAPAFKRLTTAAGGMFDRISKQLSTAFANGHLEAVIDKAVGIAKQFGHLIGDIFGTLSNVMKAASAGGGDALGSIGAMFKELRKVTAMPEVQTAMKNIFTALNSIAKLFAGTLGVIFGQLVMAFGKIAPTITTIVGHLANMGPLLGTILLAANPILGAFVLLAPIMGKLAQPITRLITALAPALTMISDFAGKFIEALAPVIAVVLDVLSTVLEALMPVLAKALPMLMQVIESLAGPLTEIIQSLIPLIGPLLSIVTALAMAFLPLIPTLMQLVPPVAQLAVALAGLLVQVLTPLVPIINGLAHALTFALAGALAILVPVLTTTIGWITKFVDMVTAGVKWIIDQFTHLYDVLVGHSIIPDLVNAIVGWFTKLWTKTKELFAALKQSIIDAWNATWAAVKGAWSSAWGWLSSSISGAWSWLRSSVASLKTSITGTWSTLWGGVRDQVTSIIGTVQTRIGNFKSNLTSAFTTLRDQLGKIWDGVKDKIASPIRWVIGTVYNDGIASMWNTLAGKISSSLKLPRISLGFNKGGVVPGTGTSDTVPIMATPNERILSVPQVARLGGHRAIDAMLGMDRSQGPTGGNPSTAEEQGRQHFKRGGIIGAIGDIGSDIASGISSGVSWAKDLVVGGLKSAAQSAISSMVQPLINRVPGGSGDWSGLGKAVPTKALDGILGFLGKEDAKAMGGPAVERGLSWARGQAGKPYQWAGDGNPSFDCSGLVSAIESVIRGQAPHRRWATGAFSGDVAPPGWVHNLMSPFMIGITNAGVGHTAGTIGGVNVESRGGDGIVVGPRARGYNNSLFTDRYGFQPATQYDQGGILPPGLYNGTGRPERVLTADHTAKLDAVLANAGAGATGGGINIERLDIKVEVDGSLDLTNPAEMRRVSTGLADEMIKAIRTLDKSRNR